MFINRYGPRTRARLMFYGVLGRDRPGLPQIRKANRSGLGSDLIGSPVCKGRRSRGAWKRMCTQQKQSQIQVPLPVWSTQQQQKSNHFHQPPFKLYNLERGGRLYAPRLARNICMFTYDIETSSTTGRKDHQTWCYFYCFAVLCSTDSNRAWLFNRTKTCAEMKRCCLLNIRLTAIRRSCSVSWSR